MWVEIFSDSHPQAVVRVGEMEVYVRRYDRVTSWYKKTAQRHTRNTYCFTSNYVEDVTPEDCWAVRKGLNVKHIWWIFIQVQFVKSTFMKECQRLIVHG